MTVEHEPAHHRFVVRLPEGEGRLLYRVAGPDLLDFWHTEVDPGLRGKGVGDEIVRAAMDFARQGGQRVIPHCPYVRTWLDAHPEYQDLEALPPT